jgi:hypothetical protein
LDLLSADEEVVEDEDFSVGAPNVMFILDASGGNKVGN